MKVETKEDWKEVEDSITLFNSVKLQIDGHAIHIRMAKYKLKLVYEIYVDGSMKFSMEDSLKDKFWFRSSFRAWKKNAWKGISKRFLKKMNIDPEAKGYHYTPIFKSFRSLKSVLSKNESIEVLEGVKLENS